MRQLVTDVAKTTLPRVPRCCVSCLSWQLNRVARKRTRCDVLRVDAVAAARRSCKPALFIVAERDALAPPRTHAHLLATEYKGLARLTAFDGEHNSPRPQPVYDAVHAFLATVLNGGTFHHLPCDETTWLNSLQT